MGAKLITTEDKRMYTWLVAQLADCITVIYNCILTHLSLVPHVRPWIGSASFQIIDFQIMKIFFHENAPENIVCEMAAI